MQIEFKDYPAAIRIGLDFVDATGIRRTSCQLVRADGYSIATADFADGKLTGHASIHEVEKPLFWALCSKLNDATTLGGDVLRYTFVNHSAVHSATP